MPVNAPDPKAQIVDDVATFLFCASIALTVWGVVSPQRVLFFTKHRTRLWALGVGLSLSMLFVAIGVYADTGQMGMVLFFTGLTSGLVYHLSRLGPPMSKLKPATGYAPSTLAPPPSGGSALPPSAPSKDS
jgi:hypothetical protein